MSDLLDLRTLNATWHLGPFAEVRVGDHVTRYVRRGSGPAVVLLAADIEANPIWVPLVESLTPGHRLFIPEPPRDGLHSLPCLRGFVEGIGLSGITLIAGGASAVSAFELATGDDFTVAKLVLLTSDGIPAGHSDSRVFTLQPGWTAADSTLTPNASPCSTLERTRSGVYCCGPVRPHSRRCACDDVRATRTYRYPQSSSQRRAPRPPDEVHRSRP